MMEGLADFKLCTLIFSSLSHRACTMIPQDRIRHLFSTVGNRRISVAVAAAYSRHSSKCLPRCQGCFGISPRNDAILRSAELTITFSRRRKFPHWKSFSRLAGFPPSSIRLLFSSSDTCGIVVSRFVADIVVRSREHRARWSARWNIDAPWNEFESKMKEDIALAIYS